MASNISSHESEVETDSVDFNRMSEDKENISDLNRKKTITGKERKAKWRASLSEKKMEEERLKDRERKRLKRSKEKLCPLAVLHRREQDRKRQQKHREKKRGLKTTIVKMGFGSKQAQGKAVKKALQALPGTPKRCSTVIESIVGRLTPSTRKRIFMPSSGHGRPSLSEETRSLVESFYLDDQNSRVMPGKKDVLSIRVSDSGPKEKRRKRNLLDDIDNLHIKYNEAHPDHKVGRTKFFQLRPSWVIPIQEQKQEVCQCIYHENINLICESLIKFARQKKVMLDFKTINSADTIWSSTVCNIYSESCCWRRCEKCGTDDIDKLVEPIKQYSKEELELYQWQTIVVEKKVEGEGQDEEQLDEGGQIDEDYRKKLKLDINENDGESEDQEIDEFEDSLETKEKDEKKKVKRVTKKSPTTITVKNLIEMLKTKLELFSVHNHTNITQLHKFKCMKADLEEGEIIISEDFSENYNLKQQNKIMTAHWSNETLTLVLAKRLNFLGLAQINQRLI